MYPNFILDTPEIIRELRGSVEKHLDWKNQDYSPFLSVFSNHRHSSKSAIRRQADLERKHDSDISGMVQVEIDVQRLVKYTWIFRVVELVEILEVSTNVRCVDPDEYLVLHYAPKSAILGEMGIVKLKQTG